MTNEDQAGSERGLFAGGRRDLLAAAGGALVGGIGGVGLYGSTSQDTDPSEAGAHTTAADLDAPWINADTSVRTDQTSIYQPQTLTAEADFNHQQDGLSVDDIALRFAVVSDGHWGLNNPEENGAGYPDTEPTGMHYEETHRNAAAVLNQLTAEREIDFLVLLGDNVHDDQELHEELFAEFVDRLAFTSAEEGGDTFFGAFGNHDWSTDEEWMDDYGHPKNHAFTKGEYGFVIAGTGLDRSAHHGERANADAEFIAQQLDRFESSVDGVFCFQHIPPTAELTHGNDMPDVRAQYARDIVAGVFVGHGHDRNRLFVTDEGVRLFNCELVGNTRVSVPRGFRVIDIYQ